MAPSNGKKPAKLPASVLYNANLKAPVYTEVNDSPKARVHQVEWRKIMTGDPVEINPSIGHGYKVMTVDEWSARWKSNDDFPECLSCGSTTTKEHHFTQTWYSLNAHIVCMSRFSPMFSSLQIICSRSYLSFPSRSVCLAWLHSLSPSQLYSSLRTLKLTSTPSNENVAYLNQPICNNRQSCLHCHKVQQKHVTHCCDLGSLLDLTAKHM